MIQMIIYYDSAQKKAAPHRYCIPFMSADRRADERLATAVSPD